MTRGFEELCRPIHSEDFYELRDLAQMAEGVAGRFVVAAKEVNVEDVFPGASAHGARLDLAEADVAQGEDAKRLEQRSGQVLYLERDRSLVGAAGDEALVARRGASLSPGDDSPFFRRLANQEEAGEVAFVVFDAGLKNVAGIFASGAAAGDAGGGGKAMSDDVFHAAGGVVKRDRLDAGVVAEEVAALVESNRVRERFAQRVELHAGRSNHVVHDAEQEFALNEDFMRDQKVGMLGDRAGQRVFDGDDGGGDRSALDAIKHFGGSSAGHDRAAGQHALGSFVAEGSEFSLDGNLDGGFPHKAS
jgi:hypothetical protein